LNLAQRGNLMVLQIHGDFLSITSLGRAEVSFIRRHLDNVAQMSVDVTLSIHSQSKWKEVSGSIKFGGYRGSPRRCEDFVAGGSSARA